VSERKGVGEGRGGIPFFRPPDLATLTTNRARWRKTYPTTSLKYGNLIA